MKTILEQVINEFLELDGEDYNVMKMNEIKYLYIPKPFCFKLQINTITTKIISYNYLILALKN